VLSFVGSLLRPPEASIKTTLTAGVEKPRVNHHYSFAGGKEAGQVR
jgi:hypothetical protein